MLGTAQNSTGFPKYRSRLNISQPCATTPALPANESELTISSGDLTCSTLKAGEFSSHPFIPGPKGFAPLRICSSVQPAIPASHSPESIFSSTFAAAHGLSPSLPFWYYFFFTFFSFFSLFFFTFFFL